MGKLKFIFGPSGSGKTTKIYKDILQLAGESPEKNFLVIVPDQFTMQTQTTLAGLSASGGILNVDVLSFGRLTHRIMTEVGWREVPVLDDTGKCLVLQRVAGRIKDDLPMLGSRLNRQGYIHEVKSVISEFMQYGLSPSDVDKIISETNTRGFLAAKLGDIKKLYEAFKEYLEGNYITREEKLDVLRELMPSSSILPDSVIVFDGFTGFTPIQVGVIADLFGIAGEVWVSLVLGEDQKIENCNDMQNLFYLSGKTYDTLVKKAEEADAELLPSEYCNHVYNAPEIDFLGKNIFRTGTKKYKYDEKDEKGSAIVMFETSSTAEEVHQAGLAICRELRENRDLQFRNIALVTGDLEGYAPYFEREFTRMGIPFYIDRTSGIRLNPITEGIRSMLGLFLNNFSAESVFRYLRSGLSGIDPEETDRLENYIRKRGLRGYKSWNRVFTLASPKKGERQDPEREKKLSGLNATRECFMKQVGLFFDTSVNLECGDKRAPGKQTVGKVSFYVDALYDFLEGIDANGKLSSYADEFASSGDPVREKEYRQIYRKVMELLEQMISLMGDDEITLEEFSEILDAGFSEIRVGTIPQTVDKVLIGDIERTRVPSVKILFFMGLNDGNIPKNTDKGGIISDLEREFLREDGFELSPSPREQMYNQRLYLYMNMTKPKDRLYLSWSLLDSSGKSLRPSYICDIIKQMFGELAVSLPEKDRITDQIVNKKEGLLFLGEELRRFAERVDYDEDLVYTLYRVFDDDTVRDKRTKLEEAAFARYVPERLKENVAGKLFCEIPETDNDGKTGDKEQNIDILSSSISQLERYSLCHYAFFLRYGLKLKEDEIFEIGGKDTGNVFHMVLEGFADRLKSEGIKWSEFDDGYASNVISELLTEITDIYGESVFQDSARARQSIKRLKDALLTSILTIRYQIGKGKFTPTGFEVPFKRDMAIAHSEGRKRVLRLRGKIDRVDTANESGKLYVRIIDYKSSEKKLELDRIYDGRQMQLPMYLAQEIDRLGKENRECCPAGMFYYHVEDPVIEKKSGMTDEEIEKQRIKASRLNGYVTNDDEIIGLNDISLSGKSGASDVIRVTYKKDGTPDYRSKVLDPQDVREIIRYTENTAAKMGASILDGDIEINPIEDESCKYCEYSVSCPFDRRINGFEKRKQTESTEEEILKAIRESNSGN